MTFSIFIFYDQPFAISFYEPNMQYEILTYAKIIPVLSNVRPSVHFGLLSFE